MAYLIRSPNVAIRVVESLSADAARLGDVATNESDGKRSVLTGMGWLPVDDAALPDGFTIVVTDGSASATATIAGGEAVLPDGTTLTVA